jgi:DNA (cytosine-5)-methyltransferase 1
MATEPLTSIDIFAGAGGLSHGFRMAGFSVLAVNDFDHDACETLADPRQKGIHTP